MLLRLTPRPDSARCVAHSLTILPTPSALENFSDAFGNSCVRVSFSPLRASELVIDSQLEVEIFTRSSRERAFGRPSLPWFAPTADDLFAYRQRDGSAEVAALAERLALEANFDPLAFFEHLNHTLYSNFERRIRVDGSARTPAQTLASGSGACRDLTVLFLAVARSLGVAGRFVSGYQGQERTPDGKRHLHAWPEVFLPELGWLGWDPTHGVAVGPGHVALSAAPEQAATMPVEGGFYFNGPAVTSTLDYDIRFEAR